MTLATKLLEYHAFLLKEQTSIAFLVARCHNVAQAKRRSMNAVPMSPPQQQSAQAGGAAATNNNSNSSMIPASSLLLDQRFQLCSEISEEVARLSSVRSALKAHRRDVREAAASRESVTPIGDHASSKKMLTDQKRLRDVSDVLETLLKLTDSMLRQLEILEIRSFPEGLS